MSKKLHGALDADVIQGHLGDQHELVGCLGPELGRVGLEAVVEGFLVAVGEHRPGAGQTVLE
jgi:hypothetical protein